MDIIFEFNDSWNTSYFVLMVVISYIVTLFCKIAIDSNSRSKKMLFLFLSFICLFFFEAFRNTSVGVDTIEYVRYFNDVRVHGWKTAFSAEYNFEILFSAYVYCVTRLSGNYTMLLIINSIFTNYCFHRYVCRNWEKGDSFILFPLFILNYHYFFSAMRSSIATAFMLLSFIKLKDNKYWMAIMLTIVGALFHSSFFLNIIFVIGIKLLKNWRFGKLIKARPKLVMGVSIAIVIGLNLAIYSMQKLLVGTRYKSYVADLGDSWLGQWNVVVAFICSIAMLAWEYKRNEQYDESSLANIFVFSFIPLYVRLNAYRIPKYYLMLRSNTYKNLVRIFNKRAANVETKYIVVMIQILILVFALLFYFSRVSTGMIYEFRWDG